MRRLSVFSRSRVPEAGKHSGICSFRRARGFTLLELLITLSVFSIGMLGISAMSINAIRGNVFGQHMTEATGLAQAKIEELKGLRFDAAEFTGGSKTNINGDGTPGGIYTQTWSVGRTKTEAIVTVVVRWTGATAHQVILKTVIIK